MAHNKTCSLILLLALVCGYLSPRPRQSAAQLPAINAVGLVRGNVYEKKKQPITCIVAIEATRDIYFKLLYNERIIKGGLLKTGPNLVDFYVPGLFQTPGIYRYNLSTKENGKETNRAIIIESTIQSFEEKTQNPGVFPKTQSRVSMFIANQLLAFKLKRHQMKLTTKTAGEPQELDYGQYNPANGRYQSLDRAGFSPLMLVGLAYGQIKKAREKKRAQVKIKTERTIYFDYRLESADEKKNKRRVSITLTAAGIRGNNQ